MTWPITSTTQDTKKENIVLVDDYQKKALDTADYPERGHNMLYPALGIAGEGGECADKCKKFWRNRGITDGALLTDGEKDALVKELGDCSWYIAAMADELGLSLSHIFQTNLDKLADRKARGVIKSEGDNR